MSPDDLREMLGIYRNATGQMRSVIDGGAIEQMAAPALRETLKTLIQGYEARIVYERADAAYRCAEEMTEAVFGKKLAVPADKPKLTLVEGGKA